MSPTKVVICSLPKTITRFVTAPRQAISADGMIRISINRQVMSRVTLVIKLGTITDQKVSYALVLEVVTLGSN